MTDGIMQVMDLAALILPSMLHNSQVEERNEGQNWLANHGCGLGNDFILLTMYKKRLPGLDIHFELSYCEDGKVV